MASAAEKLQDALDEGRILVLGTQVLVGFEYRSVFEERFRELPEWARLAHLGATAALLLTLALVILPSAWHRLAERGEDSPRMEACARVVLAVALLPFAVGLGLDVLVSALPAAGARAAGAAAAATTALALLGWYGVEAVARRRGAAREGSSMERESGEEQLDRKIRHVLTEARTVLPGAQAMLGFQLAATLAGGFRELPEPAKHVHLAAILLGATTIVLLVAPAAWHRIVERGELTERFHRVASALVVAACVPLAGALAVDLGVVAWKILESTAASVAAGAIAFAAFLAAWIVVPWAARTRATRSPAPSRRAAAARP
jgi:hypothetical protein